MIRIFKASQLEKLLKQVPESSADGRNEEGVFGFRQSRAGSIIFKKSWLWLVMANHANRPEGKLRNSVSRILNQGTIHFEIFKQMSRQERKRMYIQYNLTGGKNLFALNASDEGDIDLGASKFASWLVIKIDLCHSLETNSKAYGKDNFIKWLEEQRDASSTLRSPEEPTTMRVKIQILMTVRSIWFTLICSVVKTAGGTYNRLSLC